MSSLLSIMDSSLSAMFAARVGLQTVSHNLANANTPGYSRQTVQLGARRPAVLPYGNLGRGVEILGIRRHTDIFLLANRRSQGSRLAGYAQVDVSLREIETIFGSVDSDHLGDALDGFFNAWSDLATPPASSALKQQVVVAAQTLVADLNAMNSSLDDLERSIETTLAAEVTRLNDALEQVALLNVQIRGSEYGTTTANDLRDQRDLLIDQVAQLAKVSVLERDDGTVDLVLAGRTVVTRDQVMLLDTKYLETDTGLELSIVTARTHTPVTVADGKLAGLISSRDEQVKNVRDQLNELARLLADKVNEVHIQGRSGGSSGLEFFTGDTAGTIDINLAIVNDYDLVATSRSGLAGDNDIALEIANLANTPLSDDNGASLTDTYRTVLSDLATRRSRFEFLVQNQDNVVQALDARLASVRGVSVDEEGANLMRYQQAYDASARIITAVQDMFDTLLNMV